MPFSQALNGIFVCGVRYCMHRPGGWTRSGPMCEQPAAPLLLSRSTTVQKLNALERLFRPLWIVCFPWKPWLYKDFGVFRECCQGLAHVLRYFGIDAICDGCRGNLSGGKVRAVEINENLWRNSVKKKIIALAIAAAVSGIATAQSNVTIYGNIDMGYMHRSGSSGGVNTNKSQNSIGSASSESTIGFKGVEDLGNGLKAIFDLQYVLQSDLNVGIGQAGHQYVGLTGGFGTAIAGYVDGARYGVYGKYDPFGNSSVANFQSMTIQYKRAANAVAYVSPTFSGLTVVLAHATHTQGPEGGFASIYGLPAEGNNGDDRLYTVWAMYKNGPVSIDLDYETTKTVGAASPRTMKTYVVAGAYDFGVVKVSALYDTLKVDANGIGLALGSPTGYYDKRNMLIGLSVPMGKTTFLANVGRVDDKEATNHDANKYGIGVRYALSKRTTLYADYARISNKDGAAYTIDPNVRNSVADGVGVNGFDMGIRHSF